ncbi:MAG: transcriptional repressor [Eubacteriales bacterium]
MNEQAGETLLKSGLKKTVRREAILKLLRESPNPLSAEDLYSKLRKKGINANFSTVYRALDVLCQKNLIKKIVLENNPRSLYEACGEAHTHHLICLGCKKITTLNVCPLGGYVADLAKNTRYSIKGHKLDIYGLCPECSINAVKHKS